MVDIVQQTFHLNIKMHDEWHDRRRMQCHRGPGENINRSLIVSSEYLIHIACLVAQ